MFEKVAGADFLRGEHEVLRFWQKADDLSKAAGQKRRQTTVEFPGRADHRQQPDGRAPRLGPDVQGRLPAFLRDDGPRSAISERLRLPGAYGSKSKSNASCKLTTKPAIEDLRHRQIRQRVQTRVLKFAARQTEQSIRLGYWMDWDDPDTLRTLARHIGTDETVTITTPSGKTVTDQSHRLVAKLGCAEWGGSYFTFSTENNETIWAFLKKCHERGKIYSGHDVMPWSGQAGSAYSQMEVADGRRLTTHRSCFVRFPLADAENEYPARLDDDPLDAHQQRRLRSQSGSRLRANPHHARQRRLLFRQGQPQLPAARSANSRRALGGPNGTGRRELPSSKRSRRSSRNRAGSKSSRRSRARH